MSVKKKIIIIEDDEDVLFIISLILEESGYQVIKSESDTILSNLEFIQPDLILLDNHLRNSSGSEICLKIKSNPATCHFPVILISADFDLNLTAQECLANGYIEKPFNLKEFEQKVQELA